MPNAKCQMPNARLRRGTGARQLRIWDCGFRNERQTARSKPRSRRAGRARTCRANAECRMPKTRLRRGTGVKASACLQGQCQMTNDKCQRPACGGERLKANGNGGSLKGSDSRAQANGLGRRVGNPTPNQALKGRDKSAGSLPVAPFQGLWIVVESLEDPGRCHGLPS